MQEDSGTLTSLVSVIKQEGQITEQVLRLIADSFDITAEAGIRNLSSYSMHSLVYCFFQGMTTMQLKSFL